MTLKFLKGNEMKLKFRVEVPANASSNNSFNWTISSVRSEVPFTIKIFSRSNGILSKDYSSVIHVAENLSELNSLL